MGDAAISRERGSRGRTAAVGQAGQTGARGEGSEGLGEMDREERMVEGWESKLGAVPPLFSQDEQRQRMMDDGDAKTRTW